MNQVFIHGETTGIPKGVYTLHEQFETFKDYPKTIEVMPGVDENTFGFIYGPPKAGKSILIESFFLYQTAGRSRFLNYELGLTGKKCLFLSLEERPSKRNERNLRQIKEFNDEEQSNIGELYLSSNQELPAYITRDQDWDQLYDLVQYYAPAFVCIDSVSRLTGRNIADEEVAKDICKRLRWLSDTAKTTLFVVNHIPKRGNESGLDLFSMSGSRIYAQEADFLLGVNRTSRDVRYLKRTASRYSADDTSSMVDCFVINDNIVAEFQEQNQERKLVFEADGRFDSTNVDRVKAAIDAVIKDVELKVFCTNDISQLHKTKIMSKDTFHRALRELQDQGVLTSIKNGQYRVNI